MGKVTNSEKRIVEAGYNVGEHIMLGDSQCIYVYWMYKFVKYNKSTKIKHINPLTRRLSQ